MRICAVIPCFQKELRSSALEVLTKSYSLAMSLDEQSSGEQSSGAQAQIEAWLIGPEAETHQAKAAQYGASTLRLMNLDVDADQGGVKVSLGRRWVDAIDEIMTQSTSE